MIQSTNLLSILKKIILRNTFDSSEFLDVLHNYEYHIDDIKKITGNGFDDIDLDICDMILTSYTNWIIHCNKEISDDDIFVIPEID